MSQVSRRPATLESHRGRLKHVSKKSGQGLVLQQILHLFEQVGFLQQARVSVSLYHLDVIFLCLLFHLPLFLIPLYTSVPLFTLLDF